MKCGLLGRQLGHSYSIPIHRKLGSYSYVLFEKEPEELERFLIDADYTGLNVTIPYKKAVLPFLDELTPIAAELGAVNTIVRRDGKRIGHNTDYFGFLSLVKQSGLNPAGKKCLVLGSGGASNVVSAVMKSLGAQVVIISRTGENHYQNLTVHTDASILINATPVGMYPNTCVSPVDLAIFPKLEGVLDLIYNPARTQLLMDAEKRGIVAMNGLWMLVAQAWESAGMFTGSEIAEEKIGQIYEEIKKQTQNIILIGMPGCGKSTVGGILAEKLGKQFADTDKRIEDLAKKSIPRIFAEDGEEVFRNWETQVLSEFGKQSSLVIATGGGCVTQGRNYPLLHQNGTVIWLQRDLQLLPRQGRPLSQNGNLENMYAIRKSMYSRFADHIIPNNHTAEDAAKAILEVLT